MAGDNMTSDFPLFMQNKEWYYYDWDEHSCITYKGVRVGAIRTHGKIATIFPNIDQRNASVKMEKK